MKDGQETRPLHEQLLRQQQEAENRQKDLMTSASQSFKKDLDDILNDAQNTIKAGIQDLTSEFEAELNQERSEKQQHLTQNEEFQENLSDILTMIFNKQTKTTKALDQLGTQMKRQKMMAAAAILLMPVIFWLLVPTQQDHLQQGKPMSLHLPGRYLIMDIKTGEMANCLMLPTGRQPQCSKVEF
ncbi:hypothetical protein [uncultured Cohaesibacter sp.]|uniref:hypothetical protein n=1 Tax=uncultured Cohaesibacter sp. TaxID=1002546 RepID=UPI002931249C|nr:hypothetical protein [uncultured Cohaesibacter sp.]